MSIICKVNNNNLIMGWKQAENYTKRVGLFEEDHSTRGYEHSPPSATVSEKGRGTSVLHKYSFYCINIQNGSVFWYAGNHSLKALVSGCKTKGFRVQNQGFQDVKPRVLQTRGINFEKCKQRHFICLQIITIFTFVKLKLALPPFCIFMQFLGKRRCQDNIW